MDPQFKPPLTFAEQLRALQEHHSTCLVKISDGTLNGEIHLLNGNIVRSHFGVLDGQSAVDAVLAAGSNIEYVVSTRSETPNDDESMIVPVITWHDASADVTPVDFMREDEVTRHLAMADQDPNANDREAKDQSSEHDRKTPVAPTTQPGWGPKAAAAVPTGAFGTPRKRTRSSETPSLSASGTRTRDIDPAEPTEPKLSKATPPPELPKASATQRSIVAVLAVLFAIGLVLWLRAGEQLTSTNAATEGSPSPNAAVTVPTHATHGPNEAATAAGADIAKGAAPSARASNASQTAVASGNAPETPGGALAPTIPVRVHVSSDGRVMEAELVSQREGFAALEQQALEAARTYRFQAPQKAGKAVDVWLTVPVHFRPTPPDKHVRIKGADSIGTTLMPAWSEALLQSEPHVKVEAEALGSTTGLAALLDGSADVAASSRLVRTDELALAERLGMQLREVFVGYDAIAIIVHPSNPLAAIDMDSLASIYTQRITNWSALGGSDAPIRAFGRPGYSGTHRLFRDRVLSRLGPDTHFGSNVENLEKTADVLAAVAANPNAIGYVSMGLLKSDVRPVALASQQGSEATHATVATVRDGSYALSHPLVLYLRPDSGAAAHKLVDFAISGEGQAIVDQQGFVSLPPSLPLVELDDKSNATPPKLAEVIRVYFEPNSARIARDSQADIYTALAAVRARRSIVVVGNADSSGTTKDNQLLAQRRAEAVASQLRELGNRHAAIAIQVAAADHPIGSNETSEGRKLNRRVDVIVQAGPR
ncbi:MAG TPA: TonB family protein [Polyangiales bacterium]|nr:TonB family protein [Polyangiales bacterium]